MFPVEYIVGRNVNKMSSFKMLREKFHRLRIDPPGSLGVILHLSHIGHAGGKNHDIGMVPTDTFLHFLLIGDIEMNKAIRWTGEIRSNDMDKIAAHYLINLFAHKPC